MAVNVKWGSTHHEFKSRFPRSEYGRAFVAHWFQLRGFTVDLPEATLAEEAKDWRQHIDEGDLFVEGGGVPPWPRSRIEVKWLRRYFSPDHWPYPDFAFSKVTAYARANPKPAAHYILNSDLTYVAIVWPWSKPFWFTQDIYDTHDQIARPQLCCPKEVVIDGRTVPLIAYGTIPEEGMMPKKYESLRDKFVKEGLSYDAAQTKAAKIFNATRKPGAKPVTRGGK